MTYSLHGNHLAFSGDDYSFRYHVGFDCERLNGSLFACDYYRPFKLHGCRYWDRCSTAHFVEFNVRDRRRRSSGPKKTVAILAIGVAQNHSVKIEPKEFGKVSATTTLIQLTVISLIILGIFVPEILAIELIVGAIALIVFLLLPFLKKQRAKKANGKI